MSAKGPACVKTRTRGESAELFSLFSSFVGACQSGSFLIQRNRDKRSTRKLDVGVFTQPGSKADLRRAPGHVRFSRKRTFYGRSTGANRIHLRQNRVARIEGPSDKPVTPAVSARLSVVSREGVHDDRRSMAECVRAEMVATGHRDCLSSDS
jgi:hypothetical protein